MNNIVPAQDFNLTPQQLSLAKQTIARDCDDMEFNLFMEVAKSLKLNPLRKQIRAIVFNKNKKDKRQMAIITTIDGLRSIAARHRNYRPDNRPPRFTFDERKIDPETNPLGLDSVEVSAFMQDDRGVWNEILGWAYWDEYAPIKEGVDWKPDPNGGKDIPVKNGKKNLEDNWKRMGRIMLAKCGEAVALRKGWPDDLSGLYIGEELERAEYLDLASDVIDQEQHDKFLKKINAVGSIPMQWGAGAEIVFENPDGLFKKLESYYREADHPGKITAFREINKRGLQQFFLFSKTDANEAKRIAEEKLSALQPKD